MWDLWVCDSLVTPICMYIYILYASHHPAAWRICFGALGGWMHSGNGRRKFVCAWVQRVVRKVLFLVSIA